MKSYKWRCLPLLLTAALRADAAAQPTILSITNHFDGRTLITQVQKEDVSATPSWKDSEEAPPLPARRAMKIAEGYVTSIARWSSGGWFSGCAFSLTLYPSGLPDKWFYIVKVFPLRSGTGNVEFLEIVVFMDGTVGKLTQSQPSLNATVPKQP